MTGNRHQIILQERDRHLFRELATLRVIDREQAAILAGFHSVTRANTRLLALTRAGLLIRFFVGTLNGGKKSLYVLSPKAASLIGAGGPILRRRRDSIVVGDRFIDHQLKINTVYLTVRYPHIALTNIRCLGWLVPREPLTTSSGLIPDGYFELVSDTRMTSAFLEVDLGTENLSVWRAKVEAYLAYAVSGSFETQFRRSQFRVLVMADSERRLHSIRAVIAKATDKIFWVSSFELIEAHSFWAPVWYRPAGTQPQPLIGGQP